MRTWRLLRWPLVVCLFVYGLYVVPLTRDAFIRVTGPFVMVTRQALERVADSLNVIIAIPHLAKQNGELQAQVHDLQAQLIAMQEIKHENDLLRNELKLGALDTSDTRIPAQVISRTDSVSLQVITVNKGTRDGFTKGMAVIAQGYLVGRVDEALPHSSKVTLLTSVDSLLPVVLQNSRSVGILKGGTEGIVVDQIPRDVTIAPGEAVVTSNLGQTIKSGIPVGTVSVVLTGKSDVFQSARVSSPIDLSRLEIVFGVK